MTADQDLLREYAATRAEAAFAELVRRHLDLVYAVALRRVGGDAHLAEDVAQRVFTALAAKAAALARHPVLAGWLFTSTHYTATQLVRAERRRRAREQKAYAMNELLRDPAPPVDWERLRPLLDDLVLELDERDRDAVLLRFFEGRAFAEIGARLRLTEDGARSRVDRAVDKLQALLARRGITSTGAALGLALANQAGATAPAGLASNVTASAMAGATAASGGGVAAWLAALGIMSTTKITGGGVAIALALLVSATANGYLLLRPTPEVAAEAAPAPTPDPAPAAAKPTVPLAALALGGIEPLRAQLRAAGASEQTTRGVVEGVLRRRYREKLSAQRAEQMRTVWWADPSWFYQAGGRSAPPRFVDDRKLLREMVLDPLDRLFGPDPVEVEEQEAPFEFLPAEKRTAFAALERDYAVAMARLSGAEQNSPAGSAVIRERDERRTKLLAALSPAERVDYDLRFGTNAVALRERMNLIGASEPEFRTIMATVAPPAAAGQRGTPEQEERAVQQLVAALGYDRALDYIWAGTIEYPSYAQVAREAGLPPGTPARVLELAAETAAQALAIHENNALSPTDKTAALRALQAEVRPRLDALLPPAEQQRIGGNVMGWFNELGEGRYRRIHTAGVASGGVGTGGRTIPVQTPLTGPRGAPQLVVRRPAGGG